MTKFLEEMRSRPHEERLALASGAAFVVAGIVLFVWFALFLKRAPEIARDVSSYTESASYQAALAEYNRAQENLEAIGSQASESVAPVREYADRLEGLEAALAAASSTTATTTATTSLETIATSTDS